jgi:predicted outer membrane repeat protein
LTNVTFSGNYAKDNAGAMFNHSDEGISSPILTNVTFSGNSAGDDGGAFENLAVAGGVSSPILTNVTFSGNSAGDDSGAFRNFCEENGSGSPILTNVTFSGNYAKGDGAAIYGLNDSSSSCSIYVRNSVLWNNQDSSGTGTISATIFLSDTAAITLVHSLVEDSGGSGVNWIGGSYVDGGGNININPMFVAPIDPATAPTTVGNLRLTEHSPAIDAGDNQYITVTVDLDNKARKVDGDGDGTATVDMGAYEAQFHLLTVSLAGSGSGDVTSDPAGIDCGVDCDEIYLEGIVVTLTAAADFGSTFSGWGGACTGTGDCVVTMDDAKSVTASFEEGQTVYSPLIFK